MIEGVVIDEAAGEAIVEEQRFLLFRWFQPEFVRVVAVISLPFQ